MEEQPVETTIYSLSAAAPPATSDRREGDRHLTLYRVGSMTIEDRRELCLIKNISAGGMMIRAYCTIPIGQRLTVELKSSEPVHGQVSWVRGHHLGIAFDKPIDVIELLSASMEGPRPRMPRIEVHCHATVRDGASTYRIRACDVSQGGVKLQTAVLLPADRNVVVCLPGMPPQQGVVRWVDEGCCGITFNRLLPLPLLVGWLQDQRGNIRTAGQATR